MLRQRGAICVPHCSGLASPWCVFRTEADPTSLRMAHEVTKLIIIMIYIVFYDYGGSCEFRYRLPSFVSGRRRHHEFLSSRRERGSFPVDHKSTNCQARNADRQGVSDAAQGPRP